MKVLVGKVIATKTEKTATILVERMVVHPMYKKRYKMAKKYQVHDELGVKVGQKVKFATSKPYSKTKKWIVIEIIDTKKKGSKK